MLEMNPRQISVHGSTYAPVSKMDTQRRKGEKPHNIKETKTQWLFKWTVHQWVSCQRQDRPWLALTNAWNVTEVLVWRMKIENITTPPPHLNDHLQTTGQSQCVKWACLSECLLGKLQKKKNVTCSILTLERCEQGGFRSDKRLHGSILTPSGFLCKAAERCRKMTKQCGSFSQMQKTTGALIE